MHRLINKLLQILIIPLALYGCGGGSDGAPTPTAAAKCTAITSVPFTIDAEGLYCFTGDISTTLESDDAITISASNVTIDMGNYTLEATTTNSSSTANGIYADERSNIVIRNGTIKGFYRGIFLEDLQYDDSQGHWIEDMVLIHNLARGLSIYGTNNTVQGNTVTNTGGSTVDYSPVGIEVFGGGATVQNNTVNNTGDDQSSGDAIGIKLSEAPDSTIKSNDIENTDGGTAYGIYVEDSNDGTGAVSASYNQIIMADYGIYFDANGMEDSYTYSNNTIQRVQEDQMYNGGSESSGTDSSTDSGSGDGGGDYACPYNISEGAETYIDNRTCRSITQLPVKITDSGRHCFVQNLTHTEQINNNESAITIETDNVTIDMQGNKLKLDTVNSSNQNRGIGTPLQTGYNNIVIQNGTIEGFYYGIAIDGKDTASPGGHVIEDMKLQNNLSTGIYTRNTADNIIRRNIVDSTGNDSVLNGYGIRVTGTEGTKVLSNKVNNTKGLYQSVGILLQTADGAHVQNNVITDIKPPTKTSYEGGIGVQVLSYTTIDNDVHIVANTITNAEYGIHFERDHGKPNFYCDNYTSNVTNSYTNGIDKGNNDRSDDPNASTP